MTAGIQRILFAVCALVVMLSCQRSGAAVSENQKVELEFGGYERFYMLHAPAGQMDTAGLPLLIVLHGGGGNAETLSRFVRYRYDELANEKGFWVVYPQGVDKQWNDQRTEPNSKAHQENIDDVAFIAEIIRRMKEEHDIDTGRVFATGISNGGFMSFRLGMELSDQMSAIAPLTATIPLAGVDDVALMDGVSLLLMNGTDDPLVPYDGGEVLVLGSSRGMITSTDESINLWAEQLNCSPDPVEEALPDRDPEDGTRVYRTEYADCDDVANVVLYRVEGGGHTWPGGKKYLMEELVGITSRDIDACEVIWDFFSQQHP